MDGHRLSSNITSHFYIHGAEMLLPKSINHTVATRLSTKRSSHIQDVCKVIEAEDPDVVCLNEVLRGLHEQALTNCFKRLGFTTIAWGEAKHYEHPLQISTVVATKMQGMPLPFDLPIPKRMGGGGGGCAIVFDDRKMLVVGFHAPSIGKVNPQAQFAFLKNFLSQYKNYAIVVCGDMNKTKDELEVIAPFLFHEFGLVSSGDEPTCPYYYVPRLPPQRIDHILYNPAKMKVVSEKLVQTFSDHKAIVAEFFNISSMVG